MTPTIGDAARLWTQEELNSLIKMVVERMSTEFIALKLIRSEDAIIAKVKELGLTLNP